MKALEIARVCHEVNRAYCESLGDNTQPTWEKAPEWQIQAALAGVEMHIANPDATPEQSHESWLQAKLADGWTYGEVKDVIEKKHPCCVPYDQLPPEQKAKDYLFRAVVHALKSVVTVDELERLQEVTAAAVEAPVTAIVPGLTAVRYIGHRAEWRDTLYKTGLYFVHQQVRKVPYEIARKLLRHGDLFERVESEPAAEQGAEEPVVDQTPVDENDDTQALLDEAQKTQSAKDMANQQILDLYDQIDQMGKDALLDFAKINYKHDLKKRDSVGSLREQVRALVDQFGVV